MRKAVVLASLFLLAGCTDADWAHVMSYDAPTAYPDTPSREVASLNYSTFAAAPTAEKKCAKLADERTLDASQQGFDNDVLQQVHDKTYADCMEWAAKHVDR